MFSFQESINIENIVFMYFCTVVLLRVKTDLFQESISLVTPDNIDSKMLTSLGSEKMTKKENGSQDQIGEQHFLLFPFFG